MCSLVPPSHAIHVSAFRSFIRATSRASWLNAFLVLVLCVGSSEVVRGQSALDGFDPNANNSVYAIVVQPDGKILIGGDFTALSPNGGPSVTRNRIARLNPDGTLDMAFDPNASSTVRTIALQSDGQVIVGGFFTSIGGQPRNYIARLDATTGAVDLLFDPSANNFVRSIAVQADGKILVGGNFRSVSGGNSIGGQPRNYIARLDSTTGLADTFDPNANEFVYTITVQADGRILVGGGFTTLSPNGGASVTRNRIARLETNGNLDTVFDPNASSSVLTIAVQADGKILAGGDFVGALSIGGQTRNRIARLNATTGLADSFNPNASDSVLKIVLQPDGRVLASGDFSSIGGLTRTGLARLDATTGSADSFNPGPNGPTTPIVVRPDGSIVVGGSFSTISGQVRNNIAVVEPDGKIDRTLNLSTVGSYVAAIAVQPDGKILIGGEFTTVLGVTRNRIARLNTDGTLDTGFNPNANGAVFAIALQTDGSILVGGEFLTIGGVAHNRIARLDAVTGVADSFATGINASNGGVRTIAVQPDGQILVGGAFSAIGNFTRNRIARLSEATGTADSAFNPNADSPVNSIALQSDGKILVGGGFTTLAPNGGSTITRNRIARLNTDGTVDELFDPNADVAVFSIALQSDGKILVGGAFTTLTPNGGSTITRNHIARLNADGTADSFNPDSNNDVYSIAVQADGKILAGGAFNGALSIGGQTRNRIARLNTDGTADSFNPDAPTGPFVYALALQKDGKVLTGGDFSTIGGQSRNLFARLTNDTAAFQNLAVTQTTINWTLDGSSPQFTRVVFEKSGNGVTYSLVGNGIGSFAQLADDKRESQFAPTASSWTLTGLTLPTGTNIYIRARGFYRTGFQNGSESTAESVRNVFFAGPTAASFSVSGNVFTPKGRPLRDARVMLTDSFGNSRIAITSARGYYRFEMVNSGEIYVVRVASKLYQFAPQVVYVSDEVDELNFSPEF